MFDSLSRSMESFHELLPYLPGSTLIHASRQRAMERFLTRGLPGRRDEDWKNTPLGSPPIHPGLAFLAGEGSAWREPPMLAGAFGVAFSGTAAARVLAPEQPDWLELGTIASVLEQGSHSHDLLSLLLQRPSSLEDSLDDLNTAYLRDGALLRVRSGAPENVVVHLLTGLPPGRDAIYGRHLVVLEPGTSLTLVEHLVSVDGAETGAFVNGVTKLYLGHGANLEHLFVQEVPGDASLVNSAHVWQGTESSYTLRSLLVGGALARLEARVQSSGPGTITDLRGLAMGRGQQLHDHFTLVEHAHEGGKSFQSFKSVLEHQSRSVFNGKVLIEPGATGVDARQGSRSVLLSDMATAHSRPQLEIYADDVKCSHGATVGELDQDAMFYLRSRGLSTGQARALMLRAFVADVLPGGLLETVPRGEDMQSTTALFSGPVHRWLERISKQEDS